MQNVRKLPVVTDELQQGLTVRAGLTDTEKVFCCRIYVFNKQVVVDNNNASAQAVDDAVTLRRITAIF